MKTCLITGFIAINLLFLSFCTDDKCQSNDVLKARLESAILAAKPDSKESVVNFHQLTNFDWDELLIISPYGLVDSLAKEGIEADCINQTNIAQRDDICVLAFLKNKKLVNHIVYPRWPGDFSEIKGENGYKRFSRKNTRFLVKSTNEKTNSGKPFLRIAEIQ